MKINKLWIACQIVHENGKYDACAIPVTDCDNLVSKLKIPGIVCANVCTTKTAARDMVLAWRDMFREQGIYYWDDPEFPKF